VLPKLSSLRRRRYRLFYKFGDLQLHEILSLFQVIEGPAIDRGLESLIKVWCIKVAMSNYSKISTLDRINAFGLGWNHNSITNLFRIQAQLDGKIGGILWLPKGGIALLKGFVGWVEKTKTIIVIIDITIFVNIVLEGLVVLSRTDIID
jgi:hypothetical protein